MRKISCSSRRNIFLFLSAHSQYQLQSQSQLQFQYQLQYQYAFAFGRIRQNTTEYSRTLRPRAGSNADEWNNCDHRIENPAPPSLPTLSKFIPPDPRSCINFALATLAPPQESFPPLKVIFAAFRRNSSAANPRLRPRIRTKHIEKPPASTSTATYISPTHTLSKQINNPTNNVGSGVFS